MPDLRALAEAACLPSGERGPVERWELRRLASICLMLAMMASFLSGQNKKGPGLRRVAGDGSFWIESRRGGGSFRVARGLGNGWKWLVGLGIGIFSKAVN